MLVEEGRLEFINGGWCMHDEAAPHYVLMVDQTTRGHQFLRRNFGDAAAPRSTCTFAMLWCAPSLSRAPVARARSLGLRTNQRR